MYPAVRVRAVVAPNEPQHSIVAAISPTQAVPQEERLAVNPVGIDRRRRLLKHAVNFLGQFWFQPLIGVDNQYPRMRGLRNRPVFEIREID